MRQEKQVGKSMRQSIAEADMKMTLRFRSMETSKMTNTAEKENAQFTPKAVL